jgi:hypothetical protein
MWTEWLRRENECDAWRSVPASDDKFAAAIAKPA